ncbi:MAG: phosphoglycerate kinase, partial [Clostridia bacterium]|nr:phosphoglycerate kinase [Clostridia bacterium]
MNYNKKSVEDIDVAGKKVLVRCDFNVPLKDGEITNDKRIVAALPTIKYLMGQGAKVILCSHLGRPKGEYMPEFSLDHVAARLSQYLETEVKIAEDPEVVGANARAMADALEAGQVMLLENVRYRKEETKNEDNFTRELASLAEVFVNDA